MDNTNQRNITAKSPPTDGDIDVLAKRLSVNWTNSAPNGPEASGQVLQRLAHGRVHIVAVENRRSRGRPGRSRFFANS
jgi:hypothetical protein